MGVELDMDLLEFLLDDIVGEGGYGDHGGRMDELLSDAEERIGAVPQTLNPYILLSYDLYSADNGRDVEAVVLYAIGLERERPFARIKKGVPPDIDPLLPGAERLPEKKARRALLSFENEARFDLAARLMLLREDLERAEAYHMIDYLQHELAKISPAH